jgi:hypothetical protein
MNDGLTLVLVAIGLLVLLDILSIFFGVDSRYKDNRPNW